ncbi:MAG: hypothetical protein RBT15_01685 [Gudongella sp.]|jgi:hypothetical protein|nr:hypothetical protein [Gudongella sp.]
MKRYKEYEDQGIKVFLEKGMRIVDDSVEVGLRGVLFTKSIVVKGIRC